VIGVDYGVDTWDGHIMILSFAGFKDKMNKISRNEQSESNGMAAVIAQKASSPLFDEDENFLSIANPAGNINKRGRKRSFIINDENETGQDKENDLNGTAVHPGGKRKRGRPRKDQNSGSASFLAPTFQDEIDAPPASGKPSSFEEHKKSSVVSEASEMAFSTPSSGADRVMKKTRSSTAATAVTPIFSPSPSEVTNENEKPKRSHVKVISQKTSGISVGMKLIQNRSNSPKQTKIHEGKYSDGISKSSS
jgi:hypothetical protein